MVNVRFAPSPTGYLHIGAARTAIYNWLFARHHGGRFILRIEDTDAARSSEEMMEGIIEGLKWLGVDWDVGPLFQSRRLSLYRLKAEELILKGAAYRCFCSPEDIQSRKANSHSQGEYWEYDRRCLNLDPVESARLSAEKKPFAVRFKVPSEWVRYKDMIHGPISVNAGLVEDFILLRSDGIPTYHLSVVVDDIEMKITHVIRGDDHISNTPKQILLYHAFNAPVPRFAHQSLIFGPDRKKLSKRHGVTSVLKYRDMGFLPLALFNYLAQMSWSPGEERIYSMQEMIDKFDLDKRSRGNPVFDIAKLEWMNGRLISGMPADELFSKVEEELRSENLWNPENAGAEDVDLLKLIDLLKERSRKISDFALRARPFLSDDFPIEQDAVEKHLSDPALRDLMSQLAVDFSELSDFTAPRIESSLRGRAEEAGVKAGILIHAVRVLVLGTQVSPGIFSVLELVGRRRVISRLGRIHGLL